MRLYFSHCFKCVFFFLFLGLVMSCATTSGRHCAPGEIDVNGAPCWVNTHPAEGVVLSMSEHVDPNKTREVLFRKALLELAAGISGLDVSEDSIVKKTTTVTAGDNVTEKAQVISLATVKTTQGFVTVKAKVQGEWKNPSSRKLYLWVVAVD